MLDRDFKSCFSATEEERLRVNSFIESVRWTGHHRVNTAKIDTEAKPLKPQ